MNNSKNIQEFIKDLLTLFKFRIILSVSLTVFTGFLLYEGNDISEFYLPVLGVLFLAGGSSAVNQIQEIKHDSKMERTRLRPLVSGKMKLSTAVIFTVIISLAGVLCFLPGEKYLSLSAAMLAFAWYSLVYVYLKRKTAYAVIAGSLIGALPPVVGWTFAGGELFDLKIIYLAAFYFVWQVPHFTLLQIKFNPQYKQAGFPVMSDTMSENSLKIFIETGIAVSLIFIQLSIIENFHSLPITIVAGILITAVLLKSSHSLFSGNATANYLSTYKIYNYTMMLYTSSILILSLFLK